MNYRRYAVVLISGWLLLSCVSAASGENTGCDVIVIDVATKGLRMEEADPLDVYVAPPPTGAASGSIFKVYRPKNVSKDPSRSYPLKIYVGRLQIIDVQNDLLIGRMIESAPSQDYPRVRYETVMIGDCLRLEPPKEVAQAEPALEEPEPQPPQEAPPAEYVLEEETPMIRRVIPTRILFKFDSSKIEEKWYPELEHLAEYIAKENPNRVVVEGHTCSIGPEDYNMKLSQRRAQAVIDHLSSIHGLPKDMFEIKAYGESHPQASNDTREGRQQNRCAVTLILYKAVPTTEATPDIPADWPVLVEPVEIKPVFITPSEPSPSVPQE